MFFLMLLNMFLLFRAVLQMSSTVTTWNEYTGSCRPIVIACREVVVFRADMRVMYNNN